MAHTEEDGNSAEVSQLTRAASTGSSQTSEEQGQQAVGSSDLMKMFEDAKSAGTVVQVGPRDSGPPEPVDVEEVAMPQAVQAGDASESAWNEERRRRSSFRRLCSSGSSDVSPSQMLAALRSAVVHESTGWHQGWVEAPTSGPSLLPPAPRRPGIKPYTKGVRVLGSDSEWLDDVEVGVPVVRTSCDVLETEWRDDAGIAAPVPVTNSMHDAPQAPAAESIPEKKGVVDPLDEWEEIADVTRCCGKPVTSTLGLACLAAGSLLFCYDVA